MPDDKVRFDLEGVLSALLTLQVEQHAMIAAVMTGLGRLLDAADQKPSGTGDQVLRRIAMKEMERVRVLVSADFGDIPLRNLGLSGLETSDPKEE